MTTKHTPTPWAVSERNITTSDSIRRALAETWDSISVSAAEAHANACMIVRAVNAHEELVCALQAIVDSGWIDPTVVGDKVGTLLQYRAEAALKLAKEST